MKRWMNALKITLAGALVILPILAAHADTTEDQRTVAALDTEYQTAVKNNDAVTMDRLLARDFVVVTGTGRVYTRAELIDMARTKRIHYEHQEDSDKTVRVFGNTAVVTAKIWFKGTDQGKPFEWVNWFSDTYVRTPSGWIYTFGQASLPLPATPKP